MSAYIVDREHILYLIAAASSRQITRQYGFSWHHDGEHHKLDAMNHEQLAAVGNMLWRENVKSVSARYPNESSNTLPGPRAGSFVIQPDAFCAAPWDNFNPVQVLKACDCYEYQTCEHAEWEQSEAYAFIYRLRRTAWHSLPGYENAEWGAPKTMAEKRAEYRRNLAAA